VCFVCVSSTLYDNYNGLTYTTTIIVLFRECCCKGPNLPYFHNQKKTHTHTYITKSTFDIQEAYLKRKQNLCKSWTCICMQLWRTTSNKLTHQNTGLSMYSPDHKIHVLFHTYLSRALKSSELWFIIHSPSSPSWDGASNTPSLFTTQKT
jgi:hypothetical protein